MKFPYKVKVRGLESSRYVDNRRPDNWDQRISGTDVVLGADGTRYILQSDGGQSPPEVGWVLMLRGGDETHGFLWTLYGLER